MNIESLKEWFRFQKRDFPWRENITPYRVWISEVMLQQTRAAVVVPYFNRWMHRFPTIAALAEASLEEVMKIWEGLGYYSRARYLHEGAIYLVKHHQGEVPNTKEALSKVKGLGMYTTGAILSFAFHQKKAAVDGNVLRVISRYCLVEKDISKAETKNEVEQIVERLLPEQDSWVVMEGLIELGAKICTRDPQCFFCPIRKGCMAFQHKKVAELPIKKQTEKSTILVRHVAVIKRETDILICQEEWGKVMGGLYQFPFFESSEKTLSILEYKKRLKELLSIDVSFVSFLSSVCHSFTRFRATLIPSIWEISSAADIKGKYRWVPLKDAKKLPFCSGHRKILQML